MRLSEAIRLGAMMKPQGRVMLLRRGRTCALGAALDAVGMLEGVTEEHHNELYVVAEERFPLLGRDVPEDHECTSPTHPFTSTFLDHIWHLNDQHELSREEIADWVEKQERVLGLITSPAAEDDDDDSDSDGPFPMPQPIAAGAEPR